MSDVHSSNPWATARSRLKKSAAIPAGPLAEAPSLAQKDACSTSHFTTTAAIPRTRTRAAAAPVPQPPLAKTQQSLDEVLSDRSGSRRSFSARCRVEARGVPTPATSSSPIPFELQVPSAAATSLHEAAHYKPFLRETGPRQEGMKRKDFARTASFHDFDPPSRVSIPPNVPPPVPESPSKEKRRAPPPGNAGRSGFQNAPDAPPVSPLPDSRTGESLALSPVSDADRIVRPRSNLRNQPTLRGQIKAGSRPTVSRGKESEKYSSMFLVTSATATRQQHKQGQHPSQQSAERVRSGKKKKKRAPGHVEKDGTPYWVKKLAKKIVKGRVKTTRPSELHPVVLEPGRSVEPTEDAVPMVRLRTAPQSKTAPSNRSASGPYWAKTSLRPTGHAGAVLLGQDVKVTVPQLKSDGDDGFTAYPLQKLQRVTKQHLAAKTAEAPMTAQREQPTLVDRSPYQFSSSRKVTPASQSPAPSIIAPPKAPSPVTPQHVSSKLSPSPTQKLHPSPANIRLGLLSPNHSHANFQTSSPSQASLRESSSSKAIRESRAPPELPLPQPRRMPEWQRQKYSASQKLPSSPSQSGQADAPSVEALWHLLPSLDSSLAKIVFWDQYDSQKEGTFIRPIQVEKAAHPWQEHLQQKGLDEVVTLPLLLQEHPQDQYRAPSPVVQPKSVPSSGRIMHPSPATVATRKCAFGCIPMPSPQPAQQQQISPLQTKRRPSPPIPTLSAPPWANQHSKLRSKSHSPVPRQHRKAKPSWVQEKPMLRFTAPGDALKSGHEIQYQAFIPEPLEDMASKQRQRRLNQYNFSQVAQGESQGLEKQAPQHARSMPMPMRQTLQPALDCEDGTHCSRPSTLGDQNILPHVPPASPDSMPQCHSLSSTDEKDAPITSIYEDDKSMSGVSALTEAMLLDGPPDSQLSIQTKGSSCAATAPSFSSRTANLKKTGKKTDLCPTLILIETSGQLQKEEPQVPKVAKVRDREAASSKIIIPEESANSEENEAEPPRRRHKPPERAMRELLPAALPATSTPTLPKDQTTSITTTLAFTSRTNNTDGGSSGVNQSGIQASEAAAMAAAAAGNPTPPFAAPQKLRGRADKVTKGVDIELLSKDESHRRRRAKPTHTTGHSIDTSRGFDIQSQSLFSPALTPWSTALQHSLNPLKSPVDDIFSMPMPPDPDRSSALHAALRSSCNSNAVKEGKVVRVENKSKEPQSEEFLAKVTANQALPKRAVCLERDLPSDEEEDLFEACTQRSATNLCLTEMNLREKSRGVGPDLRGPWDKNELLETAAPPKLKASLSPIQKKVHGSAEKPLRGSQSQADSVLSTGPFALQGSGRLKQANEGLRKFVVMGDCTLEAGHYTRDTVLQIDMPRDVVIQNVESEIKVDLSSDGKETKSIAHNAECVASSQLAGCEKERSPCSEESYPSEEDTVVTNGVGFTAIDTLTEKARLGEVIPTKDPKLVLHLCSPLDAAVDSKANQGEEASVTDRGGSSSPELAQSSTPSTVSTGLWADNSMEQCCNETATELSHAQPSKRKHFLAPWAHEMVPAWSARSYAQVAAVEPFMPENAPMGLKAEADMMAESTISKPDPVEDRVPDSGECQIAKQAPEEALQVLPTGHPETNGTPDGAAFETLEFNLISSQARRQPVPHASKPTVTADQNRLADGGTIQTGNHSFWQVPPKPKHQPALALSLKESEHYSSATERDGIEQKERATSVAAKDINDADIAAIIDKQDKSISGSLAGSSSHNSSQDRDSNAAEAAGKDNSAEMEMDSLMSISARGGTSPQTMEVARKTSDESVKDVGDVHEADLMAINRIRNAPPDKTIDMVEQITRAAIGAVDGFNEAEMLELERQVRQLDTSPESVKLVLDINKEATRAAEDINEAAVEINRDRSIAPAPRHWRMRRPPKARVEDFACEITRKEVKAADGIREVATADMMDVNVPKCVNHKTGMSTLRPNRQMSRSPGPCGSPTWTMDGTVEEITKAEVQAVDGNSIKPVEDRADASLRVSTSPSASMIHTMDPTKDRPSWHMSGSRSQARLTETALSPARDISHALVEEVADKTRDRSIRQALSPRKQANEAKGTVKEALEKAVPEVMDAITAKAAPDVRSSCDAALDAAQETKKAADQVEAATSADAKLPLSPTRHRSWSRNVVAEAGEAVEGICEGIDQAMDGSRGRSRSLRHSTRCRSQARPTGTALVSGKEMKKAAVESTMSAGGARAKSVAHAPRPVQHAAEAAEVHHESVGKAVAGIVDAGWLVSSSLKDAALDAFQEVNAAADQALADVTDGSHRRSRPLKLRLHPKDGARHAGVSLGETDAEVEAINEKANCHVFGEAPPFSHTTHNGSDKHDDNDCKPPVVSSSEGRQIGHLEVPGQGSPTALTSAKMATVLLHQQASSSHCFRGKLEGTLQLSDEAPLSPLGASVGSAVGAQHTQRAMAPMQNEGGIEPPSTTVMRRKPRHCSQCGAVETDGSKFKYCGKCRLVKYCTRHCQKKNWKVHRARCCKQIQEQLCSV